MPYEWKRLKPLPADSVDVLKRKKDALERVLKVKIVQLAQIGVAKLAQRPQNEKEGQTSERPRKPRTAPSDDIQTVTEARCREVSLLRVPAQVEKVDYTTPIARRLPAPGLVAPSSSGNPGECWSTEVPSQPPVTHLQPSKAQGFVVGELPAAHAVAKHPSRYKPLPFQQPPAANPHGASDGQAQAVHAQDKPAEEVSAKQERGQGQSREEECHGTAHGNETTGGKPESLQGSLTDPMGAVEKRKSDPISSFPEVCRKEGPARSNPPQKRSRLSTVTAATGQLDMELAKRQPEAPSKRENVPPSPKWQKRKAFRPAPRQEQIELWLAAEKPAGGLFRADRKSASDPVKRPKLNREALTTKSEERRRFGGLAIGRSLAGKAVPLLAAAAQQASDRPLLTPTLPEGGNPEPQASGLRRRRSLHKPDIGDRDVKDDHAAEVDTGKGQDGVSGSPHERHESLDSQIRPDAKGQAGSSSDEARPGDDRVSDAVVDGSQGGFEREGVRLGDNDETPADLEPSLFDYGVAVQPTAESVGEERACPLDLRQDGSLPCTFLRQQHSHLHVQSVGAPTNDVQLAALPQMGGGVACQRADVAESTQVVDVLLDHGDATQPSSATDTPSIALASAETEASPAIGVRMPCEGTVVEDTPRAAESGYESDDRSSDSMGPCSAGWAHAVATPHSRRADENELRANFKRSHEDSTFKGRRKHLPDLGTVIAETPQASADALLGSEELNIGVCDGAGGVRKELWKFNVSDGVAESSRGGNFGEESHLGSEVRPQDYRRAVLEKPIEGQEFHTGTISFLEEEKGKGPAAESEEGPASPANALLLEFDVQVFAAAASSDGRAVAICVGSAVPGAWELQVWQLNSSAEKAPCLLGICSVPAEEVAPSQFLQLFETREGRLTACKLWGSRAVGERAAISLLQVSGGRACSSEVPVGFECGALLAGRTNRELLVAGRGRQLACLASVGTEDGSVSMAAAAVCSNEVGAESVPPLVVFLAESADGGTIAGSREDGSFCVWNRDRRQLLAQHSLPSCSVLRALPVERHTAGNGTPLTALFALASREAAGGKRQAGLVFGAVAGPESIATEQVASCQEWASGARCKSRVSVQEVVQLAISSAGLIAAAESSGDIRIWSPAEEACPAILPYFGGRTIVFLSVSAREEGPPAGQPRLVAVTSDGAVMSCTVHGN